MRTPAPATLVLLGAGINPKTIADDLEVTPQAISFHLAGKSAVTSYAMIEAIYDRAGPDVANRVFALIEASRKSRRAN